MTPLRLQSPRLDLIEITPELAQANLDDLAELARLLHAEVARTWPCEHWEPEAIRWLIGRVRECPAERGWFGWYVVKRQSPATSAGTLIGTVGCKGPPDAEGAVEIGYGIVSECRRLGFATEACRALIDWAMRDPRVKSIAAETFPNLVPSLGVMRRLGMRLWGDGSEPGVVRHGVSREEWRRIIG